MCVMLTNASAAAAAAPAAAFVFREWSRVPEEEKGSVRNAVLQLMLSDPSDRVALQLGLLASNICAFDFPSRCVTH